MIANRKQYTSKGCLMCIRRRVKCDQTRPACKRCTHGRVKRVCPGYRGAQEIGFRHTFVLGSPNPPTTPSMREVAIPHFIASFTSRSTGPAEHEPMLQLIDSLSSENSAVFTDALTATSSAYFVQRMKPTDNALRLESLEHYSRSLSSLRVALSSPNFEAEKDAILIAMALLLYRDQILGEGWSFESPHAKAAFSIMLQSGCQTSGWSPRFLEAKWMILAAGAIGHLLRPGSFPHPSRCPHQYEDPQRDGDFRSFILRTSFVCTKFQRAYAEARKSGNNAALMDATERVLATESLSRQITEHLVRDQMYGVTTYEDPNAVPGFSLGYAHFFPSIDLARMWSVLWLCRIRLLDSLNTFLGMSTGADNERDIIDRLRNKAQITDDLLAAVPYMLNELDSEGRPRQSSGVFIHGPGTWLCAETLFVAGSSHGISAAQKEWTMARLNYIGHDRAIGEALRFRSELQASTISTAFAKDTGGSRARWNGRCKD